MWFYFIDTTLETIAFGTIICCDIETTISSIKKAKIIVILIITKSISNKIWETSAWIWNILIISNNFILLPHLEREKICEIFFYQKCYFLQNKNRSNMWSYHLHSHHNNLHHQKDILVYWVHHYKFHCQNDPKCNLHRSIQ